MAVTDEPGWRLRVAPQSGNDSEAPAEADAADADLVRACLEGSRAAFDLLVQRHQRQIYQLCYRFVGGHEEASDLAQDVFVRAYRGLRGYKGSAAFSTWLYRIAVNVCLSRVGAPGPNLVPLERADRLGSHEERPDAALLREERAASVRRAIAQLPDRQRATLILRIYHELPHQQIAAILGSSVGSAKGNLFHALANLRKRLQKLS